MDDDDDADDYADDDACLPWEDLLEAAAYRTQDQGHQDVDNPMLRHTQNKKQDVML